MVIFKSHRTRNMILRYYPNVSALLLYKTYQILSPVLFQQSLYFPLLIHRIFNLLVSALFFTCFAVLYSSRSFAPPKKWLFSIVTWAWAVKCARRTRARASRAQAQNIYSSCIIFVVYMYGIQSVERVARIQLA